MDKKTLLALILSLLVLYVWATITTKPTAKTSETNKASQLIENYSGTEENAKHLSVAPAKQSPDPALPQVFEKIEIIEADRLTAEFSNIGGSLSKIYIKEYAVSPPLSGIGAIDGYEKSLFVSERPSGQEIVFTHEGDEYIIKKSYTVSKTEYTITTTTTFANKTNMSKLINLNVVGMILDMSSLDIANNVDRNKYERDRSMFEYVVSSEKGVDRRNNAFRFSSKNAKSQTSSVHWVGFRNRYFCAVFKPTYETYSYSLVPLNDEKLAMTIQSNGIRSEPGSHVSLTSFIYVGPENFEALQRYKYGIEDITRYYRLTLLDAIAKIIYSIMHGLYRIIPNWGICIILISTVIYFSMYPLTLRSMLSMKNMQALNPQISSIRAKYKDNPQKMNTEVMNLYKKHKINPMGGCLPMLLQTPVFVGLYQVLWRSVSLKGANFLWIKDLSEPDRLFIFPFKLPIIGSDFNVLPVIMIFVMMVQQKLTSKAMPMADSSQAAQQKMMSVIMPIFLGIIFYNFASGLTLYFTMFYIFSTLMQWKMSKEPAIA
jgi:YidC/Oxa1 family membrane protein insertase